MLFGDSFGQQRTILGHLRTERGSIKPAAVRKHRGRFRCVGVLESALIV